MASRWVGWIERAPPRARVIWLGLCAWAITAVLPTLHRTAQLGILDVALLGLPLVLLGVGLSLEPRLPRLTGYVLLSGYPVAIALAMSRFEQELSLITYSPASLLFALVALAGYAASASQLLAAHSPELSVEHKPLGEVPPSDEHARKQRTGLFVLGAVTVACVAIVLWGSFQSPAGYREHWGRTAPAGATLTALLSGLVGAAAVAFVAPGLRAERRRPRRDQGRLRKVLRPLLAALSFAALYLLSRHR